MNGPTPARPSGPTPTAGGAPLDGSSRSSVGAPATAVRVLLVCAAVLAVAGVAWLVFWLLLRLPLLTTTLVVALLLTALMAPAADRLQRTGLPRWASSAVSVLVLLTVLFGIGLLFGLRATSRLRDLTRPLGAAVDRIRVWLVEGPLALDPGQVADLRNQVVAGIYELTPSPTQAARSGLYVLSALLLVLFLVFFLLKDGAAMWSWAVARVPARRRDRFDGAGRAGWQTLRNYTGGVVFVAVIDAVGIGAALLILGVPLWPSLTLLVFLGAFVPLFGATVSGAVAVLVTMVTNGPSDALVVLVVVLVVQQVEGNVLQPLIMSRAVNLHPAVVLVAVTAGALLWGIVGALVATPTVAVAYRIAEHLRSSDPLPSARPQNSAPPAPSAAPSPGAGDDRGAASPRRPAGSGATAVRGGDQDA